MKRFGHSFKRMSWFTAVMLGAVLAGCGGGGDGGGGFPGSGGTPTQAGLGNGVGGNGRGPAPVNLLSVGTNNFVILSKTGITNTGSHLAAITGNIGSSPITAAAMNGVFCAGPDEITGSIFGVDAAYVGSGNQTCFVPGTTAGTPNANKTLVDNAVADMDTAYADAVARAPDYNELGTGIIGGLNLGPATYKWTTVVSIPTNVTLTGGPNDVWIFQISQGLSVASGVQVFLAGGALPQNVFWATVAAADIGTTARFKGVILSQTSIVTKTGASVNGRLLARTAVSLDANAVGP